MIDGRDKTSEEIDREITDYINSLVDSLSGTARVQSYYRAVSLSPVRDSVTGYPGNQPSKGYQVDGGLYYSEGGGPEESLSFSISLPIGPLPFSLSVGVSLGNATTDTVGMYVRVPDAVNRYKLKVTKEVEVHPVAVYEVDRPNAPITENSRLAYVTHTQTVLSIHPFVVKA